MILVTKYKLSNTARNAIISFFNKHANYSTSPLPKNIKHRKFFMNNMKSNLSYMKTKVLDHDNTEYFLYHMLLISCIKNILEIPDISQNFVLEYEELHKITEVYITFNIIYKYLKIILEPIQKFLETGINLLLNSKDIWFYPKVSTIIADWPEATTFCLTYKSMNSKHSCHFCLVSRDDLANTMLSKHACETR